MTLAESLSGLARDVHSDQDPRVDYQTLKDAILSAYGVTVTSSKIKLHQLRYNQQGNFSQHIGQVETFLCQWLEPPQRPNE